uniref:DUF4126 domain-containing protein n=1 Tax=Cyanothece sp. (strain PCC 7425 / ATCC 29141) TaxID=395961 RepID=B8HRH8_CYAP4
MIELLAILAASAAGGLRLALPLLIIGLLDREMLWSQVPLLSRVSPYLVVGVLAGWSFCELFITTQLQGQRVLQLVQLLFSPLVGGILGITVAQITQITTLPTWVIGLLSGMVALVLQLVQTGWFYRLKGLPLWAILGQDLLCVGLVLFSFQAPKQGGLIALLLLWLALRSSRDWRLRYLSDHQRTPPPSDQQSQKPD